MAVTTRSKQVGVAIATVIAIALVMYWASREALPKIDAAPSNPVEALPDFSQFKVVEEKKAAFFNFLLPIVSAENARLKTLRASLLKLAEAPNDSWSSAERKWLTQLAQHFLPDVSEPNLDDRTVINALLKRVDSVPPSLVLAQAAIESAWGTSRFARQGNNLFGQWCFSKGCGLVPRQRADGKHHEVAKFDTVNAAVRAYLHNLNAFAAYKMLREIRNAAAKEGKAATGRQLARGLLSYSEQGEVYVSKVRRVIAQNNLQQYDTAPLESSANEAG